MSTDYITKTCTKCGNSYPATTEYFYADKRKKSGLQAWCKACVSIQMQNYYQANREKRLDYYQTNRDKLKQQKQEYQKVNSEKIRSKQREYRQANPEKIRGYYQTNRDQRLKYSQNRYQTNRDEIREQHRKYQQANPEKFRIRDSRRQARQRQLPDTFTHEQWIICLEYFGYTCAVCSISFENISIHADHWIPLSAENCPGTVATNMICLCASCNLFKHAKTPDVWLKERYEIDKVDEILQRIESYFEYIGGHI